MDFHNSEMKPECVIMLSFNKEERERHVAVAVCLVCGDTSVCFLGDSFNSRSAFADDDTTMRVPEWDGVRE